MQKIDLEQYMTITEAREALGSGQRGIWRAIERAGRENVCFTFLGRTLVRKDKIDLLREHYYPYYSEAHQKMVKAWGAAGGHAKAKKTRAAAKKATARPAGRGRA